MNVTGGAFEGVEDQVSPFGYGRGEGVDAGHGDPEWICSKDKPTYDQVFQSLNPIDGKVTGAGMNLLTLRQLCAQPHLRSTIIVNKALDAILSSTQHCSLLTELCVSLKDRTDESTETLGKVVDALSVATHNSSMLAQFLANYRTETDNRSMSSAMSIHSLSDSLPIAGTSSDYKVETSTPNSSKENVKSTDDMDDSDSSSDAGPKIPDFNLDLDDDNSTSFIEPVSNSVKFIFLLVLNVVSIMITTQVIFITLVYIFTGQIFLELNVEKSPQSWFDRAKVMAFGPAEETIRIHSIFEVFYRHNLVNILKHFIRNINNTVASVY